MDFGKLFEKLFTDREFNNEVRQLINKKDHIFEKQELLNNLHNIKENSIWSRYFKDDNLNVVTKKHHEIRTIRNKVMHSKKLTHEEYIYSKKLLSDANDELEKEIANRVKYGNEKSFDYSGLAKSLKLQFFVNDEVFTSLTDNFQNAMSEYYGKVHSDAFEQYLKAFSSSMLSSYWNTASSDNKIERKDGDEEEAENSNQKE